MAKKVQLMTNAKEWQTVNGVEVLVDVPQEDIDPVVDSSCVEIEGHRTLEETISQENMFTPEIVETKVHSKVGGVYHDNVVDGAYEEAILYGNTQVNLVESITNGAKYIPHSFTSFQGNESKIGNYHNGRTNQVAPLVKGVTMVNLCQETSVELTQGQSLCIDNIKGSTKYTISFIFTQKNSQAGIVIQSYNGETYLENSKLQSDLGDEVVMTFITHENANKIYINNGVGYGGETIQLDNIMVIEGDVTDLDLPFFKGMRSVELSRPLTNLFTDDLRTESLWGGTATNSNGMVVATAESIGTWKGMAYFLDNKLKPNTKYLIMWDSLIQTQTSTTSTNVIIGAYHHDGDTTTTLLGKINDSPLCPVARSIVFDTGNYDVTQISIRVHATLTNSETGTTTVTGLRVFEWDDSLRTLDLQTIGYFSGTKYVSARALETEGKNLYPYGDVNFTSAGSNWYDAKGNINMYGDVASKSKSRFLLKKGTYTLSIGSTQNIEQYGLVDDKETTYGNTFTLTQDTYMTLRFKRIQEGTLTTATNIQIERGETATTYEAYNSRYYKPRETEEIILRSLPNGICDTFNLQTGELVQRIHSHVFDGATYELNFMNKPAEVSGDDVVGGWSSLYNVYAPKHNSVSISCDIPTRQRTTSYDADYVNKEFFMVGVNTFIISLSKTRLNGLSISQYLTRNPITVQYELAEPIITKLQTYNRIYNGQGLVSMGNNLSALTYYSNNYYVKAGNLSPVPAILEPITSIPYDVRLKPSTLYTVKYNRGGNSNSMSFDLGGSIVEKTNSITDLTGIAEELTVRTPAILSHEQIRLSGTGYAHNFIIVEGDITGTELPYFEGMKDVKMPIVKNISKNLFDGELIVDKGINQGTGAYHDSEDWVTTKNLIPITKGKKISITIDADDEDITTNRRYAYVYKYDMNGNFIANDRHDLGLNTKTYTMNHYGYIKCTIRTHNVKNITITETDTPQPCIDYRVNSVYAVQGEYPITSEMFEQGGFNGTDKIGQPYDNCKVSTNESIRIRTKDLIPVKPNTQYTISNQTSPNLNHVFYCFDGNRNYLEQQAEVNASSFTTTDDCYYVSLMLSKNNDANLSTTEFKQEQFRMYELDSTINLRSLPNGVKDELNLLTGEYIQRVGEVVFDGSDDEDWNVYTDGDFALTPFFHITFFNWLDGGSCTNKYHNAIKISSDGELGYCIYGNGVSNNIPRAILRVRTNEIVNGLTIESWKEELKISPLILQYKLAEPIISHVRLVSNNQEREVGVKLPNGVSNTYNPSTGITTVRVGKIVLDGSENWEEGGLTDSSYYEGWLPNSPLKTMAVVKDSRFINGNFTVLFKSDVAIPHHVNAAGKKHLAMSVKNTNLPDPGATSILIQKSKMSTQDLVGFKAYLSQNPITVWYELNYPQIQPDIVLPNGVHDEYNPETGVYTKKVGFVELDGSEHWVALSTAGYFYTEAHDVLRSSDYTKTMICDDLQIAQTYGSTVSSATLTGYPSNDLYPNENWIYMIGSSYTTKDELISSLSQNPLKVWYELATPITYQLTPYFGLPQPYAYEDGYLIHDSAYAETTLPPEFKYKLVANRTGQVMQNNRKLQEHTTRLSNLEALIIEATIQSLFDRELQLFELELMDIQLIDLGE